jgi:CubicO group peptidase (beta-lactamase class C family)
MKYVQVFSLLCLVSVVSPVGRISAQEASRSNTPTIPDTPAGRQLANFLRALNTGDVGTIRTLVSSHFAKSTLSEAPVDRHVAFVLGVYNNTRGLDIHNIERSSDDEIIAWARSRLAGDWVKIWFRVEATPPYGIAWPAFMYGTGPPSTGPHGKASDAEIVRQVESYLQKLVGADLFSGAVIVAKDGKPLFKRAYGLGSRAFNVPNRVDTKFNIASMNKMFTAIAVAQLAEQGKLSFDDPVGKYLPDFPNTRVAEKVTLHHLLTHTSGMGDYMTSEKWEAVRLRIKKVQDYFPLFAADPLSFEPGQKWKYSNAGYIVLGAIIEKVSGQSYFDYVREHIFKPAGMDNTDAYELDIDTPNLATGYTSAGELVPGARKNNVLMHVVKGGPAGGGYSTAEDLLEFSEALRDHKLLSAKYTEMVLTGKVAAGPDVNYGYGLFNYRINGKRVVGHNGILPGGNAQLDMYLDLGYTVIVLSNYDDPAAQRVVNRLRELITL